MHVVNYNTLRRYAKSKEGHKGHRALLSALNTWYFTVKAASWANSADVKRTFRQADIIDAERVVFDIKGNDYRLVAAIKFQRQTVLIKFIGTHEEYDEIDPRTVSLW